MKQLIYITMAALAMSVLSSCNNDDEPALNPDKPTVSAGAYFLCQGQYSSMIEGGLYALDYESDTMSDDIFKSANGISLGDTPQCGICYGGKIYVGVYGSNCIFVIDKSSYKVKKTVSLVNSTNGQQPRSMVARDGKVYIAMYDGYVARMDTTSMEIDASVKVGQLHLCSEFRWNELSELRHYSFRYRSVLFQSKE